MHLVVAGEEVLLGLDLGRRRAVLRVFVHHFTRRLHRLAEVLRRQLDIREPDAIELIGHQVAGIQRVRQSLGVADALAESRGQRALPEDGVGDQRGVEVGVGAPDSACVAIRKVQARLALHHDQFALGGAQCRGGSGVTQGLPWRQVAQQLLDARYRIVRGHVADDCDHHPGAHVAIAMERTQLGDARLFDARNHFVLGGRPIGMAFWKCDLGGAIDCPLRGIVEVLEHAGAHLELRFGQLRIRECGIRQLVGECFEQQRKIAGQPCARQVCVVRAAGNTQLRAHAIESRREGPLIRGTRASIQHHGGQLRDRGLACRRAHASRANDPLDRDGGQGMVLDDINDDPIREDAVNRTLRERSGRGRGRGSYR